MTERRSHPLRSWPRWLQEGSAAGLVWLLLVSCSGEPASSTAPQRAVAARPPTPADLDGGDPWWRSAVFYEVFVRSFADSSTGPLAGDGVGDLQGLIERLDYLNDGDSDTDEDLEVGALWLMPIMQSPSYHGYDVTDYRTIEKDYGTNQDFQRLIGEARRRGIRVIVDLVLNHTSSEHPWFRDAWRPRSPYHDWYLWSAEPQDYFGPWGQPVWHQLLWWQRGWRHFNYLSYYGIFWSGMPDLDYRCSEVTAAMYEISRLWLQDMGADGFRLDAIRHLIENGPVQQDTAATHAWLRDYHAFLKALRPDALTVGEVWADTEVVATYGADELDLTFQFSLAQAILDTVRSGEVEALADELSRIRAVFPDGRFATFLSNHDQVRVLSFLDGRVERAKLAATILLTAPGVPFIYYGEEIGMTGMKPDPRIRKPMQWDSGRHAGFSSHRPWQDLSPEAREVNVELQGKDDASLLAHYRRLIRLRNRHPVLRVGDFEVLETGNESVFALLRTTPGESLLVLVNSSEESVRDYGLSLDAARLPANGSPEEILQEMPVAAHEAAGYRPLIELAPLSSYLIRWGPPRPS